MVSSSKKGLRLSQNSFQQQKTTKGLQLSQNSFLRMKASHINLLQDIVNTKES